MYQSLMLEWVTQRPVRIHPSINIVIAAKKGFINLEIEHPCDHKNTFVVPMRAGGKIDEKFLPSKFSGCAILLPEMHVLLISVVGWGGGISLYKLCVHTSFTLLEKQILTL